MIVSGPVFEGFTEESFATLERLRHDPTVEQLRRDREAIRTHVQEPFGRYRDALVLGWVLPHHLPFETEKGVFSRLPKNDFGAGGAHHHLWMSFYRPPRRRLSDVQLSHGIYPDAFSFGLYLGAYAKGLFRAVLDRLDREPDAALDLLNPLLEEGFTLAYARTVTRRDTTQTVSEPLGALPDDLARAKGIWLRRTLDRETVLGLGPALAERGIEAAETLMPLYRWMIAAEGEMTDDAS